MLPTYAQWAEPASRSIAEAALDECALPAGARVLDLCTGSGALALAAAERGHLVQGIDVAPMSVTYLAGRLLPFTGSRSVLMDATAISYPPGSFDAAFSWFGVMFFGPAVPAVLSEMRTVVRADGTVAIAHWANAYGSPYFEIFLRAAQNVPEAIPEPIVLGMEYLKRNEFAAVLTDAGFADVRVEPSTADYSLPAAEHFLWELNTLFAVLPVFRSLTYAQRAALDAAVIELMHRIESGAEARPVLEAHVAYCRVPGAAAG